MGVLFTIGNCLYFEIAAINLVKCVRYQISLRVSPNSSHQTIGGWRAGPASPAQPSPPAAIHRPSTAPHPNPNPAESLRQKAVAHHAPSPEASSSNLTTSRHAPANSSVPDVVARVNGVATVEPKLVAPLGSHRLLEEDLVTCRRFKPHALMQPTLFSTGTAASAAGGIALPEGVSIGGGEGRGEDTALGVGGGRHGSVRDGQGSGAGQGEGGIRLLNAWEKIEELEGLVESSRSHNERWASFVRRVLCLVSGYALLRV